MNKKNLVIFLVIFLGLSLAIYQYAKELQTDLASAAYPGVKPANGHSWTEMECTAGLCVTTSNKVGIGTDSPGQKLEVNGSILASGEGADICTGSGACLSQIASFIGSQPIVGGSGIHNRANCEAAGGTLIDIGLANPTCRFAAATCPSGWTQYENWSTTGPTTCGSGGCYQPYNICGYPCTTGGHAWSNNSSTYSCTYGDLVETWDGGCCSVAQRTCVAIRTQIGCF